MRNTRSEDPSDIRNERSEFFRSAAGECQRWKRVYLSDMWIFNSRALTGASTVIA